MWDLIEDEDLDKFEIGSWGLPQLKPRPEVPLLKLNPVIPHDYQVHDSGYAFDVNPLLEKILRKTRQETEDIYRRLKRPRIEDTLSRLPIPLKPIIPKIDGG